MLKIICSVSFPHLNRLPTKLASALLRSCCLLLIFAFGGAVTLLQAQTLDKQKLTASYLYNFAKNIELPNEASATSFNSGLYGTGNPQLMTELSLLASNVKLRDMTITVSQINTVRSLANYHLIYIEQANSTMISDAYDAIGGRPILLVTSE